MEQTKQPAITVAPTAGDSLAIAGGNYRIIIGGQQTQGEFAVIDMLVPAGGGPGPHAHAGFQENFYVVEGEIEVRTETQTYVAGKGAFVNIPKGGIVHSFKNKGEQMAHLLCIVVPAGLDEFFKAAGTPVSAGTFLPAVPMDEAAISKLKEINEKYGQQLFPPDYLDK
jgi:quercetin dioxygenase-like cupin family protein